MNSLLERQLRKHLGDAAAIPGEWKPFVDAVGQAYDQFDDDRKMLERSLDLSSAELGQTNSQMRAVFDAFPDVFFRLDAKGTILDHKNGDSNGALPQAGPRLGARIQDIHPSGIGGQFEDAIRTVMEQKRPVSIEYALEYDDSLTHHEARLLPLPGDQLIAIVRDISARKTAEAELLKVHLLLEEKVEARTMELRTTNESLQREISERHRVNKQLVEVSRQAGMAEVATSVLHNVGNVLNSVNVSCSVISDKVRQSPIRSVAKTAALLQQHADDLGTFFNTDPAAKKLPNYLGKLANLLVEEQAEMINELQSLAQNIEHIKDIVSVQQSYAKNVGGVRETLPIESLVEDALRMDSAALDRHHIKITREFSPVPPVPMEKHKVLQILINLIRNAKHALSVGEREHKQIIIQIAGNHSHVRVSVKDNGIGIAAKDMTRIFAHGFTTKEGGHGFGLHSGILAAQEMGGNLTAQSDGPGAGATFTIELPLCSIGSNQT